MSLKLYYDLMSQPSRSLYILLKYSQVPFEQKYLDLRKGAHFSDEFTAINRLQKVPVIEHNGFILTESVAIMRYLADVGLVTEKMYPREAKARARVDEALEWQHIGLRLHLSMYFRVAYMDPILSKTEPNQRKIATYESRMVTALDDLDTKWLGQGHRFLAGDTPTYADLHLACEVEQPRMAGFDPTDRHPNIAAWLASVRSYFEPHYEEAHVTLNKVVKKYASLYSRPAAKL